MRKYITQLYPKAPDYEIRRVQTPSGIVRVYHIDLSKKTRARLLCTILPPREPDEKKPRRP